MSRKKKESFKIPGIRETLVHSLQMPPDMMLGVSRMTLIGNQELWIENYKGILEYTEQAILLQTQNGRICIRGCGLRIAYYTNEDMKIVGTIQCVQHL